MSRMLAVLCVHEERGAERNELEERTAPDEGHSARQVVTVATG